MTAVLGDVAWDTPVPSCPEWVTRDLVRHLGGVHRWAAGYVTTGRRAPIRETLEQQVGGWPHDDDLLDWFDQGAGALVDALSTAPDDLACWTFLDAPSPRAFWARRQAHETSIHRVDAEFAAVVSPEAFPGALALDGTDEVLRAFITRPRRGPRNDVPVALGVAIDDRHWLVRFDSESTTTTTDPPDGADVVVRGDPDPVYRWVWNRAEDSEVEITGDAGVAATFRRTVHIRW